MGKKLCLFRYENSVIAHFYKTETYDIEESQSKTPKIWNHKLAAVDTKYRGLQIDISLDWKYHVSVLSS